MTSSDCTVSQWLAQLGLASRGEAKTWVMDGRVKIGGQPTLDPSARITPGKTTITLDGKRLPNAAPPRVYWMLHKPARVSSTGGTDDVASIYDLPRIKKLPFRVWAWPQLDFQAEGLVILTNDSVFLERSSERGFRPQRQYQVLLSRRLTPEEIEHVTGGVKMRDGPAQLQKLHYAQKANLGASTGAWYVIHSDDARRKFLTRLFAAFEVKIVKQVLLGIGALRLPANLKSGQYRQMDAKEIRQLRRLGEERPGTNARKREPSRKTRSRES